MNDNQSSDERELEQWLARGLQHKTEYIDDQGFTDQVMSRLPEHSVSRRTRWLWPLLVAVLVGLAALLMVPVQPLVAMLVGGLMAVALTTWLQVGAALLLLAVAGAGYWVWREV